MSQWVFKRTDRGTMYRYTRPGEATYVDSSGVERVAGPDEARINHDRKGNLIGMKFGDGDTMSIPLVGNRVWRPQGYPGTLVIIGQAPTGVELMRCGAHTIYGDDAMKLYIIPLTAAEVETMVNQITFFHNKDDVEGPCHVRLAKYYADTVTFPSPEKDMMTELNNFMHGAWY